MALSEVELVDDDLEPAPAPPHRRRRWLVAAGAVVVVGALLAGGQAVLDARERAHQARFDDVAGVLAPLPDTLRVLWRRHVPDGSDPLDRTVAVSGHLVDATTEGGRYTIRSIDRATGEDAWTVTGEADLPSDIEDAYTRCQPVGADALVACVVEPAGISDEPGGPLLVVVDAADGSVVDRRPVTEERWAAGGGAVVTATSDTTDDRATWTLDARDGTGRRLWHRTLDPVPLSAADRSTDNTHYDQTDLQASGDRVVLTASGHVWWLDDGVVTGKGDLPRDTSTELVGGMLVRTAWERTGTGDDGFVDSPSGVSLQAMGHDPVQVDGDVVPPTVDDGSAGVVLVRGASGVLDARDTRTGLVRWSAGGSWDTPLVLGGTVFQVVGDASLTLVARDAATGEVRWSHDLVPSGWSQYVALATDGRFVYAVGTGALEPFSVDDGAPQPSRRLPVDLSVLPDVRVEVAHGVLTLAQGLDDGAVDITAVG